MQMMRNLTASTDGGGRYVCGVLLATGGMSVVCRATGPSAARGLVVKMLRPELVADRAAQDHFNTEIRALRRLEHENIVHYVDSGEGFLVTELVLGVSLAQLSGRSCRLSLARVVGIGEALLAALAHAHGRGVIHADVKCDNLMIDTKDGIDHVTLIDFGIARLVDESSGRDSSTLAGTPEYMAPEVIRGEAPGAAADLYAVGVILYELLTGATPFSGESSARILLSHLEDDVIPPSLRCPERMIPMALERVVMRALDRDPTIRFTSADTFAIALRDAARDLPASSGGELPVDSMLAFSTEAPTREWGRDEVPDAVKQHGFPRGTQPVPVIDGEPLPPRPAG